MSNGKTGVGPEVIRLFQLLRNKVLPLTKLFHFQLTTDSVWQLAAMQFDPTSLPETRLSAEKRDFFTQVFECRATWSGQWRGETPVGCSCTSKLSAGGTGVSLKTHHTPHLHQYIFACASLKPVCILYCSVEMTNLTDACVEDMCAAIKASKTLKRLGLKNNSLTDASVPALVQVMQQSQNMEKMK